MSLSILITFNVYAQEKARTQQSNLGAIWHIGDSITQSNADGDVNGSPRKSLYDLLIAAGYGFTFTGSFSDDSGGLPSTGSTPGTNLYYYHSGYSGALIGPNYSGRIGITQNIPTYWTTGRLASVKPDIILIMIGTNDADLNLDFPNAPARLTTLINTIYARPGIGNPIILLASIPPSSFMMAKVINFNATVPGVVSGFQSQGKKVYFVDQFTAINNNYATVMRPDNLHPNSLGNKIIAKTWFDAIIKATCIPAAINTQPTDKTTCINTTATITSVASGAGLTYQWQVNNGSGFSDLLATSADAFISYTGGKSANLDLTPINTGWNGYTFRVIDSGDCSPAITSNVVTLTVNPCPVAAIPDLRPLVSMTDRSFIIPAAMSKSLILRIANVGAAGSATSGVVTMLMSVGSNFTAALNGSSAWILTDNGGGEYNLSASVAIPRTLPATSVDIPLMLTAKGILPKGNYNISFTIDDNAGGEINNVNNTVTANVSSSL